MTSEEQAKVDAIVGLIVAGNRILGNEGVCDAYGHISHRHPLDPTKLLLSRSRSPELVEPEDIMTIDFDGKPVDGRSDPMYYERFIHCGIYEARPDIQCVIHSHARSVLAFTISDVKLVPVIHTGSACGCEMPVWDIEDKFGDTNLLVSTQAQGRDLAQALGKDGRVALMRGHGFAAAGRSLVRGFADLDLSASECAGLSRRAAPWRHDQMHHAGGNGDPRFLRTGRTRARPRH